MCGDCQNDQDCHETQLTKISMLMHVLFQDDERHPIEPNHPGLYDEVRKLFLELFDLQRDNLKPVPFPRNSSDSILNHVIKERDEAQGDLADVTVDLLQTRAELALLVKTTTELRDLLRQLRTEPNNPYLQKHLELFLEGPPADEEEP